MVRKVDRMIYAMKEIDLAGMSRKVGRPGSKATPTWLRPRIQGRWPHRGQSQWVAHLPFRAHGRWTPGAAGGSRGQQGAAGVEHWPFGGMGADHVD